MKSLASIIAALALLVFVGGCGNSDEADKTAGNNAGGDTHTHDDHADDAAAALLCLFWLDFLAAGRKLVLRFLVDLDPLGINETPGSGMVFDCALL